MTALQENPRAAHPATGSARHAVPSEHHGVSPAVLTLPASDISGAQRERTPAPTDERHIISPPLMALEHDSYGPTAFGNVIDRSLNAAAARFTFGLDPGVLVEAWLDWLAHLAAAPGKRIQLFEKAAKKTVRLALYGYAQALPDRPARCIEPLPQDHRFDAEAWQRWPYNIICQGFLLQSQWWHNATTGVRGVRKEHERMLKFTARQILDMLSPSNFLPTSPELRRARHLRFAGVADADD